jgi:hypothetical protein
MNNRTIPQTPQITVRFRGLDNQPWEHSFESVDAAAEWMAGAHWTLSANRAWRRMSVRRAAEWLRAGRQFEDGQGLAVEELPVVAHWSRFATLEELDGMEELWPRRRLTTIASEEATQILRRIYDRVVRDLDRLAAVYSYADVKGLAVELGVGDGAEEVVVVRRHGSRVDSSWYPNEQEAIRDVRQQAFDQRLSVRDVWREFAPPSESGRPQDEDEDWAVRVRWTDTADSYLECWAQVAYWDADAVRVVRPRQRWGDPLFASRGDAARAARRIVEAREAAV